MPRSSTLHRAVAGIAGLVSVLSVAPGARAASTVSVAATPERSAPGPAQEPPRGIHSWGTPGSRPVDRTLASADPLARSTDSAVAAAIAAGALRKISGTPMTGSVTSFAVSPNGATAVYIADQETAGRFELYRAPVNGSSAAVKLSTGLALGTGDVGVSRFEITPDGSRVVFLADANHGAGSDDLFSVPIDGSASPVQLSAAAAAPVTAFGLSPDSATAVFFGLDTVFGSGRVEAYAAPVGAAASAHQISDVGTGVTGASVVYAIISANSARVVYAADPAVDGRFQWFSVPAGAAAPGQDVQLSAALGSVSLVAITPDSSTAVYTADEGVVGVQEIYSVPVAGGARVRLDPAMAGSGVDALAISPNGTRVAYLADQNTAGVTEVYRALVSVAGSGIRLNPALAGTQLADTVNVSPDGTMVLYEADQNSAGTFELFSVPIDGGAAPTTLHSLAAPDDVGYFDGLGTPIIGRRAVYPVLGSATDLFSVPFDGSEPFRRLNDALAAGTTVFSAFLPRSAAARLVAFGTGAAAGTVTSSLYAVPLRRDLPPEPFNVTAGSGRLGVSAYEIAAGDAYAVYLQDQDTAGKPELYARELDSDGDSVINAADNCPFSANLLQNPVVFGQTVRAENKTRFGWSQAADVRFVRGPLALVGVLATDDGGTRLDTRFLADSATPAAGAGFYYLVAPNCAGRSYQSQLGAEPGRDTAPFP